MVLLVRLGLVGWRCHTNHCHPAADGSSGPHRSLLIQYPKQLPALFWAPPAVVSCVQRSLAPPVLTDPAGPVTTHGAQTPACLFIAHLNCGEGWEGLVPTPSPAAYIFHCLASSSCVQRSRRVSCLHWFWCGEFQLLPGSLSKLSGLCQLSPLDTSH